MSRLEGFLSSIAENPRDDSLWLILADWLDEQDDPRGELVRLQDALRQPGPVPDRAAKEARLRALLAAGVQPLLPRLTNSLGMQLVRLSACTFWMGGSGGKAGNNQIEISHVFCIGVHPVTQGQWQDIMGNNPSHFCRSGGGKDKVKGISDANLKHFPVECVSWDDVQEFLKRLNARERDAEWVYRLPTEEEWEYACRGGASSKAECSFDFYLDRASNDLSSTQANFDGNYPVGNAPKGTYLERTTKVGSYKPNRLGIYDMHGNVWEWTDTIEGSARVIRGGGWGSYGVYCRAAHRRASAPSNRDYSLGCRLARVPSPA